MTRGKLPLLFAVGLVSLASFSVKADLSDGAETNSLAESRKNSRSSSSSPAQINSLSSSGPSSLPVQDALQPIFLQGGAGPQQNQGHYILPLPANGQQNSHPGASAPYYIPQYGVQYVQFIPRPVVVPNYPNYQQPQHYSTLPVVPQVQQSLHHGAHIPQAAQYILPPPPGHHTLSQQQQHHQQQQQPNFLSATLASYTPATAQTSAAGSGAVPNSVPTHHHHHQLSPPLQHSSFLNYNPPSHYSSQIAQPLPHHPHHHHHQQQQTQPQSSHQQQQQQQASQQVQLQSQPSNVVQTHAQPPALQQQQPVGSYSSPVLSYFAPPQPQQRSIYSAPAPSAQDSFLNTNEYVPVPLDNSGYRAVKRSS